MITKGYCPLPNSFITTADSADLTNREYRLYKKIGEEIFRFPEGRESLSKELSVRFLASLTHDHFANVSKMLNSIERKGLIKIIKSHTKGQGSIIFLVKSVVNNTTEEEKSVVKNTTNPKIKNPKKDLPIPISDSSLNSSQGKSHTCDFENSPDCNNSVEASPEKSNNNTAAFNSLAASPTASNTGNNDFAALGSVLTSLPVASDTNNVAVNSIGKNHVTEKVPHVTIQDKGKAILLKKGFSSEEVQNITDRITASMESKNIRNRSKYFIAACNNEVKINSKVAIHNTSHKVAAPPSRPSPVKIIEKPVNPAEVLEKIKLTAPTELFHVIMDVDNEKINQKALAFLPGELKKEALANLYVAAFKEKYPDIMENIS
mgnify:CR=1 FL=1